MSLPKWAEDIDVGEEGELVSIGHSKLEPLKTALAIAWEALEDVFKMIDEGKLVRDISKDSDPDYAMRSMDFVMRLKKNYEAMRRIEELGK